jgi:hypothetical protein
MHKKKNNNKKNNIACTYVYMKNQQTKPASKPTKTKICFFFHNK